MLVGWVAGVVGALVLMQPGEENRIASQSRAKAIVERAIKAHGGDARLQRARNVHLKLRAKAIVPGEEDAPFDLEIVTQLPDRYRSVLTTTIQGVPVVRTVVVNGRQGWVSLNGEVKPLSEKDLKEAQEQMYAEWLCRLLPLRDSDFELREMEEDKIQDRWVQVVNVVRKGCRDVNLYFDKQTGLLVKMEHTVLDAQSVKTSQEVVFAGYRDTNGPKHWTRVVVSNGGKRLFEAEVVEVRFPERLDERLFQKPPEVKPPGSDKSQPPAPMGK
jgi:hypothetical protein